MTQIFLAKDAVTQATMTSNLYNCFVHFFFWQKDPKIAKYFEQGLGGIKKGFKSAIIKGQNSGEISTDKDPESLADFLTGLFYGLLATGSETLPMNSVSHIISNALIDLD
ncbi:hypothetical protein [Methylomonas sp. MK1]|uniref:hypothetical protein n=1 Tax=Methylomonas sp. MK1 TaxID=1131552 RepID=UPI000370350B|nr:hypothetical protein [Methylomonas sp. MK1]